MKVRLQIYSLLRELRKKCFQLHCIAKVKFRGTGTDRKLVMGGVSVNTAMKIPDLGWLVSAFCVLSPARVCKLFGRLHCKWFSLLVKLFSHLFNELT